MSLWKIAWRSIQQRALASTLTAISMGLGVALVVAVLVVQSTIGDSFRSNASLGYDMIVGAKGAKIQLVLNTVFYLSSPVENIPYSYYKEFTEGKYKPYIARAVPVCLGDYYEKYRVVGTTPEMFQLEPSSGRSYQCAAGHIFAPEDYFGAVIGATVARETGLTVGSDFQPTHGAPGKDAHKHDPFKVVGVLAATGTPNDRALFINIEGFYLLDNHARPVEEESATEPAASADQDGHGHAEHAEHNHAAHELAEHGQTDHEHAEHDHDGDEVVHGDDHAEHEHAEHEHDHAHEDERADHEHAGDEHAGDEHAAGSAADLDHSHEHGDHHEDGDHHEHGSHHDHGSHEHGSHEHHHHAPLPENQREVTAVLLLTASPPGVPPGLYSIDLVKKINKGQVAQAVLPIREIVNLFELFVGPIELLLLTLTVLIVVVAGIGILVSIYNSMSERRREIAVMRALGAGRSTVMLIVLLESILLSLCGGLLGWLLGHVLIAALNPWVVAQTGVAIGFFQSVPWELVIIPGLIALAALVGYLPAMVAYRTDVAKALVAAP